ncbi:conserved hypothetical protein [Burkholderia vietnamiensis]|nr:conserved hypothetical protein [Burkholderia vietnamiensis]
MACEGFAETVQRHGFEYRSARDFRDRNILELIQVLRGPSG